MAKPVGGGRGPGPEGARAMQSRKAAPVAWPDGVNNVILEVSSAASVLSGVPSRPAAFFPIPGGGAALRRQTGIFVAPIFSPGNITGNATKEAIT